MKNSPRDFFRTALVDPRRRGRRIRCNVTSYGGGASTTVIGRIRDLSGSGVFLETQKLIDVGKHVYIEFELETGKVEAMGEVRWISNGESLAGMGIRFLRLSSASARAIDDSIEMSR